MITRTPVIGNLPKILILRVPCKRTPVIDGIVVRSVAEIEEAGDFTKAELAAMVELAGIAPSADPAWSGIHSDAIRYSCAYFASEVIRGPRKAPYSGKFLLGRHHLEWDALISKHKRLNILAARDHGKSFFFTLAYPIWKAGFNAPGSSGVIFSATQAQATEFLGKIKAELLENPKLAHLEQIGRAHV